jgi:hypothetical protein
MPEKCASPCLKIGHVNRSVFTTHGMHLRRILEAMQDVELAMPIYLTRSHSGGESFRKLCLSLNIPSSGRVSKKYIAYYVSFEPMA